MFGMESARIHTMWCTCDVCGVWGQTVGWLMLAYPSSPTPTRVSCYWVLHYLRLGGYIKIERLSGVSVQHCFMLLSLPYLSVAMTLVSLTQLWHISWWHCASKVMRLMKGKGKEREGEGRDRRSLSSLGSRSSNPLPTGKLSIIYLGTASIPMSHFQAPLILEFR